MPAYTRLRGITEWGNDELTSQLTANMQAWLEWGFLGVGAFNNVNYPSSGVYGGRFDTLHLVNDPAYSLGQVWEAPRQNWVWESGVDYSYQPIRVSGVYVDNTFYSVSGTGTYAHHVNYPLGRIVFDSPIATTSAVRANYSYKLVSVTDASAPWFKEIMPNSMRVDDSHLTQTGSGMWDVLSQNRIQLPAVVIEVSPRIKMRGLQLGGGQWVNKDVVFHVFSDTPWERDKLVDAITYQKEMTLLSFNTNRVIASGKMPLDGNGSPVTSGVMYPDLVDENGPYFWKKLWIADMRAQDVAERPPIYQGVARATIEIDFPELA